MPRLAAFLCVALVLALTAPPARAQAPTSTLEMTGRAVIEAPADVVRIELAARHEAATACDALAADAGLAGRIAITLHDLGVSEPDIETVEFRFATTKQPDNPMANPPGEVEVVLLDSDPPPAGPAASGEASVACGPPETYRVESTVSVALRRLDALDAALARLGGMAGIEVLGRRYSLAETDALFAAAHRAALEDAEAKAAAYAAAMSLALEGPLGVLPGPARLLDAVPGAAADGAPRVAAQASVTLIYEVRWE